MLSCYFYFPCNNRRSIATVAAAALLPSKCQPAAAKAAALPLWSVAEKRCDVAIKSPAFLFEDQATIGGECFGQNPENPPKLFPLSICLLSVSVGDECRRRRLVGQPYGRGGSATIINAQQNMEARGYIVLVLTTHVCTLYECKAKNTGTASSLSLLHLDRRLLSVIVIIKAHHERLFGCITFLIAVRCCPKQICGGGGRFICRSRRNIIILLGHNYWSHQAVGMFRTMWVSDWQLDILSNLEKVWQGENSTWTGCLVGMKYFLGHKRLRRSTKL